MLSQDEGGQCCCISTVCLEWDVAGKLGVHWGGPPSPVILSVDCMGRPRCLPSDLPIKRCMHMHDYAPMPLGF